MPPDIDVEQTPADVIDGHDPQLEKAIALALDELKKIAAPRRGQAAALQEGDRALMGRCVAPRSFP